MRSRATRRDALKQILAAGVGMAASPIVLRGQPTPITIAGQPVEIAVASISPATVRITITGATAGASVRDDGALVRAAAAPHKRGAARRSVRSRRGT